MSVSGVYRGLGLTKSFTGSLSESSIAAYELGLLDFGNWPNQLSWNASSTTSSNVPYSNEYRIFGASSQNGWIGVEPYLHIRQVQIWEPVAAVLSAVVSTANESADLNGDGTVDGGDFLVWQRTDGTAVTLERWKAQFGTTTTTVAIPEPSSMAMALLASAWVCRSQRKKSA